ncbi:MAG: STAS domain-containing protein [bacterium]|nr:STAS domain-containing protein [bacterium]
MATHFEPLKLARDDVFGVRLSGSVTRRDKDRLQELAEKCLDRGHQQVLLDLSELDTIGGGGAKALAQFQKRLVEAGGGTYIVGAGEVVKHFLTQSFADVPLDLYVSVEAALAADTGADEAPVTEVPVVEEPEPEPEPESVDEVDEVDGDQEIGAVGFSEDVDEAGLDDMLEDAHEAATPAGRRKGHQYTSLSDAVASLGSWSEQKDHAEFNRSLGNLLFSHGLAEEAVLMVRDGDEMVDAGGERRIPVDCGFIANVARADRPITLLDIPEEDIDDDDAAVLESLDPDVILPVIQDDELTAMILLKREGEEREYSVAESFALELLMRVLTAKEDPSMEVVAAAAEAAGEDGGWEPDGTTPAEVLLQLALDLPEALDRPHFWRIFARHCWPVLPVRQMGLLGPDRSRPQIMVGGNDSWMGLELGAEKLQLFFQSMERPVAVGNMPSFFQEVRDELAAAGAQWIVALKWEGVNLGTVLLELDAAYRDVDPTELLEELFTETSRLLSRYDGSHDNADVNLELVRILVLLRERNCCGTDILTGTMTKHVARLARVMAFPPDQERDLLYGCLLRDIGLFDRNDDFMDADKKWSPAKREVFRKHPDDGVALLTDLKLPQSIMDVVRCHHERFDGKGFPRGLEGHRIPLAARVVAVAEHYAEMVTGADGQSPLSPEAAAELLRRASGTRFDPDLVDLFLKAVLPSAGRKRPASSKSVPQEVLEPVGA